jgi:hypothetical protein
VHAVVIIEYKVDDDESSDDEVGVTEEDGYTHYLSISVHYNVASLCLPHRQDTMHLFDGFEWGSSKYKRDLFAPINMRPYLQYRLATYVDVLIRPPLKSTSDNPLLPQPEQTRHSRDDRSCFSVVQYINDDADVIHEMWSLASPFYLRCAIAASAFDQQTRSSIAKLTGDFVDDLDGYGDLLAKFADTELQQAVLRILNARFGRTVFSSRNARVAVAPIGFHFHDDNGRRLLHQRRPSHIYSCWFFVHRYLVDTLLVLMSLRINTNVLYEIVSWLPTVCLYKRSQLMRLIEGINKSTVSVVDQRSGIAKIVHKRKK